MLNQRCFRSSRFEKKKEGFCYWDGLNISRETKYFGAYASCTKENPPNIRVLRIDAQEECEWEQAEKIH